MSSLLTTAQLAAILGVDRSIVTRRVQSGKLTPVLTLPGATGAYLFDEALLERDEDA